MLIVKSFGQEYRQLKDSIGVIGTPISLDPSNSALSFLDEELKEKRFFFTTELHRTQLALQQQKAFVKYLLDKDKLDKLVIQRPYVYGYLMNEFLKSGDTLLLKKATDIFWMYDKFHKYDRTSHDSYAFYKWLRELCLSTGKEIQVAGIDLDHSGNGSLGVWALLYLIKKQKLEAFFPKFIEYAEEADFEEGITKKELNEFLLLFNKEFPKRRESEEHWIADKLLDFQKMKKGLNDALNYNFSKEKFREEVMTRNFLREIKPDDYAYGQFGDDHIYLDRFGKKKRRPLKNFLAEVSREKQYQNKITNIHVHCENCVVSNIHGAKLPYVYEIPDGYKAHNWFYYLNEKEHNYLISRLAGTSSALDFEKSWFGYSKVRDLFRYVIVLF